MPRFSAPIVIVAIAAGAALAGCSASAHVAEESSPARPTFELRMENGPGAGTYLADQKTTLSICSTASDGSWRYLYGGGDPFVNLDLLVGGAARQSGGEAHVAAEIEIGGDRRDYVRFDPMKMRGGDPPGRSTATVTITEAPTAVTFAIRATTPERVTGIDGPPVDVDLTVTCPT